MSKAVLRIATRKSPLAFWQANFVKHLLQQQYENLEIELFGILTVADKMLATPLTKIGGKGLFVKELEKAILEHQADIAVHSIKDMPAELPDGLQLAIALKREDPRDAFVSNKYNDLYELPAGAVIGTSSLRRQAQILALRPDLNVKNLRGNVGTRLKKLDENEFDAIILAAAGLIRLELMHRIKCYFEIDQILPAPGQGAIGIECRSTDKNTIALFKPFDDQNTQSCILAERAMTEQLGGSCQFPIAAHATISQGKLVLKGLVSNIKGTTILRTIQEGLLEQANEIGKLAAQELIHQGANELLDEILCEN